MGELILLKTCTGPGHSGRRTSRQNNFVAIRPRIGMTLDPEGRWKPRHRAFIAPTRAKAEAAFRAWQQRTRGFDPEEPVGLLLENYLYGLINSRDLAYNTKSEYLNTYRILLQGTEFSRRPLNEINALDYQQFIDHSCCPDYYLRFLNALLGRFCRFLSLGGDIPDITRGIRLPARKRSVSNIVIWTPEELLKITGGLDQVPHIRFMIILMMNTGLRISELLGLQYGDIQGHTLHVERQLIKQEDLTGGGKTSYVLLPPKSLDSRRSIPLSDPVLAALREHRIWRSWRDHRESCEGPEDMIFLTRYGNPYDKRSLQGTFNRYYRKIGVPCRGFHTYRHTFATELVEAGAPIEVVSKLLGHSNINVTAKYYVSISEQTKAQAIRNLAALHQAREAFRIY